MRDLPDEEKPEFGKMVNQVKSKLKPSKVKTR